eukprot:COSAG02_NODE_10799_length_1855_cov_147.789662_3_plen_176_part_00
MGAAAAACRRAPMALARVAVVGLARGHTAAPVALRWRCTRRRAAWRVCRGAGSGGAELGGSLVPFGAVPSVRCSSFPALLVLLAASRVAGLLGPGRRFRLRLLGSCLVRALQRLLDAACPCRCVARERRASGTRPFSDCSPSSAGSFLTAFARAARRISRQAMVPLCPAPSKYPG